jgi:UDP-glucose 4-epimerase
MVKSIGEGKGISFNMNILLTGAFGNVGRSTIAELLRRGHQVRCFDVRSRTIRRSLAVMAARSKCVWGDLRQPEDVAAAVSGVDSVLHVGFVIPKLSVTGVNSEDQPDFARTVNVGGTQNLVHALCGRRTRALVWCSPPRSTSMGAPRINRRRAA